ncbi:hypothetical protein Vadar_000967 [Vaccinium darrowii]|uniref:Uncharacterized protein n=1 Tax=Vaccinium darrowii TaxID=229202 RepID=A0ACB7XEX7_9ERIC|nr:hypothetical protein Vadar_000967 [Vaccinium darrowii]
MGLALQLTSKTRREKFSPVTKLGFLTELRDFSDSITMATPPPFSSRPTKRRRENQNEHEDEDRKDSTATATVQTIESSPNGTEKDKKKKMSPLVVFAHGAGAPSSSDWMIRWRGLVAKELQAVEVVTFDYPYISGGKWGAPPKAEKLVDFHVEVVKKALAKYLGHPLVLARKSMGSVNGYCAPCSHCLDYSCVEMLIN